MARKTYEEASGFESMSIAPLVTETPADVISELQESAKPSKRAAVESQEKPDKKHRFKKDKSTPVLPQFPIEDSQDGIHPSRRIDHTLIGKHKPAHNQDEANDMDRDSDFEKIPCRDRKLTCFNCRKTGHTLQRCPQILAQQSASTDKPNNTSKSKGRVCYICGSANHAISRCLKVKDPLNPFPFAECFVCNKTGHISGACPENARGVYPKGGSCVHCDSVRHLAKDCDKKVVEKKREEIELGVLDLKQGADDDDVHIGLKETRSTIHHERIRQTAQNGSRKKAKVVKF